MRPLIAISTYTEDFELGPWSIHGAFTPMSYVRAVRGAGGRPLLLPPDPGATDVLDGFDGLVLIGGSDVDPSLYGAPRHDATTWIDTERDRAEVQLARIALDKDIPLLAICRGLEVLNVAQGGTLVQHLPEVVGHTRHLKCEGAFRPHPVTTIDGRTREVASYHHQAIDRLGAELVPFAWADDGTIEGVRHERATHAVGVLWHPEVGDDQTLFVGLVKAVHSRSGTTEPVGAQ
jgi:putative glutamine amidotransferase